MACKDLNSPQEVLKWMLYHVFGSLPFWKVAAEARALKKQERERASNKQSKTGVDKSIDSNPAFYYNISKILL